MPLVLWLVMVVVAAGMGAVGSFFYFWSFKNFFLTGLALATVVAAAMFFTCGWDATGSCYEGDSYTTDDLHRDAEQNREAWKKEWERSRSERELQDAVEGTGNN